MRRILASRPAFILLLVLARLTMANAQAGVDQGRRDSLKAIWSDPAQPDSNRLKAIQALTWPMLTVNLDSVRHLAGLQLAYARKVGSDKWIGRALYNLATHFYYKGEPDSAIAYYNQSLPYRKKVNDRKGEAAIYGNLGLLYNDQGDYLRAMQFYEKSLAINEEIGDVSNLTSNYSNMAVLYKKLEDSAKVVEYSNKCLSLFDPIRDRHSIGITYNNLGVFYKDLGDFDRALDFQQRSLAIREALADRMGMAINHINLGTIYLQLGQYEEARGHVLESMRQFRALGDTTSLANGYTTLGDLDNAEGHYRAAVQKCQMALELFEHARKVPEQMAACKCLYIAHKGLGEAGPALVYHERLVMLDDSLKTEDVRLALARVEFIRRMEADSLSQAEEQARVDLRHAKELGRRNRQILYALAGGLLILVFALVVLGRMLRYQRNEERLKMRTRELEHQKLVSEISLLRTQVNPHFLFNSLSILSSLVRVDAGLSETFIDQLSKSYRYILEQSEHSLVSLRTELGFIDSYAFLLRIRFENKFNLDIQIPESALDRYLIAPLTLQLLIENAVKHNRMSLQEPLVVRIVITEDNMLEVSNLLQPRTSSSESTGIGLRNIKNRYQLLTDKSVWSGETEGRFVVRLPLLSDSPETN